MPVFRTIASVFPKRRSDTKYDHFSRSRPIKTKGFRLTKNSQICLVCADYPQISRCRQGKCGDFAETSDISLTRVIKLTTQSLHTVNKALVERGRNRRICVFRRWQVVRWYVEPPKNKHLKKFLRGSDKLTRKSLCVYLSSYFLTVRQRR